MVCPLMSSHVSSAPTSPYVVIMAGGSGTRFWPWSRPDRPKQLLPLAGDERSLLRATFERAAALTSPERILIVTSERLREAVQAELPELAPLQIMAEPMQRNTAPCIAWAAARIRRCDAAASMIVLPADHRIDDMPSFSLAVERGLKAAAEGWFATVGIVPDRPETGYGYIEIGAPLGEDDVHRAERFVEKPDAAKAAEFLSSGRFLWNAGMFFFRVDALAAAFARELPSVAAALEKIQDVGEEEEKALVRELYPALPSISIDYGIMEKAERVAVVAGRFDWSDLGSWQAAWENAAKDAAGNALPAQSVAVDSENCYVRVSQTKKVALIGVSDLVVVESADALLIVPRARCQEVRAVAEAFQAREE